MVNWIEKITHWYINIDFIEDDFKSQPIFRQPATMDEVNRLEQKLNIVLSPEHSEFLRQSNGLSEQLLLPDRQIDPDELLFSVEQIEKYTLEFRDVKFDTPVDFDNYIVCGSSGVDGIYFAYRIMPARCPEEIYGWYPSERIFRVVAPNLVVFLQEWISGELDF